jgi:hypothetical protein
MKLLLFYNWAWNLDPAANPPGEGMDGWEISSDPSRFKEAAAVVFHVPTVPTWQGLKKVPGQKWICWSAESEALYIHLRMPHFMDRFDLRMTYQLNSDVPVLYIDSAVAASIRRPAVAKSADAPCVMFLSNTRERSERSGYLVELMQYIKVDSYGAWNRNRELPQDLGRETKLETISGYKFTLAFENSIATDYVSEKLFDPLIAGSVPVYLGAPNIENFAPSEHCFINVKDFENPRALADELLALAEDPVRYDSYLAWKTQPFRPEFVDLMNEQLVDFRVRLRRTLDSLGR